MDVLERNNKKRNTDYEGHEDDEECEKKQNWMEQNLS